MLKTHFEKLLVSMCVSDSHHNEEVVMLNRIENILSDEVKERLYLQERDDWIVTRNVCTIDLNRCSIETVHDIVKELFLSFIMLTSNSSFLTS